MLSLGNTGTGSPCKSVAATRYVDASVRICVIASRLAASTCPWASAWALTGSTPSAGGGVPGGTTGAGWPALANTAPSTFGMAIFATKICVPTWLMCPPAARA
ncbi:hypothetical protein [Embleya sp. NBC_00896]|uniref:hypothetical protein n=1 Tax=Embleya sp. NBC_00896 TaxID=2975961 RepID=UPI0038698503|nr:hypothetical protein OG928_23595 [Embleya sp. NBC_00896]